jgi:hypothetical protein
MFFPLFLERTSSVLSKYKFEGHVFFDRLSDSILKLATQVNRRPTLVAKAGYSTNLCGIYFLLSIFIHSFALIFIVKFAEVIKTFITEVGGREVYVWKVQKEFPRIFNKVMIHALENAITARVGSSLNMLAARLFFLVFTFEICIFLKIFFSFYHVKIFQF